MPMPRGRPKLTYETKTLCVELPLELHTRIKQHAKENKSKIKPTVIKAIRRELLRTILQ